MPVKPSEPHVQEMMVIDRTIRGGQEITSKGSVLICGNVNPGAQVIAGGSVDIREPAGGWFMQGLMGIRQPLS